MDATVDPAISGLELGGELLRMGAVSAAHVRPDLERTGPIVLLVGCHTGADERPSGQLRRGVPLPGSGGRHLNGGRGHCGERGNRSHSAGDRTRSAGESSGTIGEALRSTRRRLLADGEILGLLLIAHGDADWKLGAD